MRKLLFITAFTAASLLANAQTSFGFKAGANLANLRISAGGFSLRYQSKLGGNGGLYANIPLATNFRIQPEAMFSMEGARVAEAKIRLNYVNIPVMLQYSAAGFYGETGPQLGILASAKATEDGDTEDIRESFETLNLSWGVGAGYRLPNGLGFGIRYNLGISNIIKTEDVDDGAMRGNVFQFGLSLALGHASR